MAERRAVDATEAVQLGGLSGDPTASRYWRAYPGHAVKGEGNGSDRLTFASSGAATAEQFVELCKARVISGAANADEPCGGFVVNYVTNSRTPEYVVFKTKSAAPYGKAEKDTFLLELPPELAATTQLL